jgi:hypothetical protein
MLRTLALIPLDQHPTPLPSLLSTSLIKRMGLTSFTACAS